MLLIVKTVQMKPLERYAKVKAFPKCKHNNFWEHDNGRCEKDVCVSVCVILRAWVEIYDDVLIYISHSHFSRARWRYLAPIDDRVFGMTSEWIVVITICTLLMMLACGVGISICVCRRNTKQTVKSQMVNSTNTTTSANDVNGQKHLNFYRPAVLGTYTIIIRFIVVIRCRLH
jgi:hypothetical protein